jgi:hypothetical protein
MVAAEQPLLVVYLSMLRRQVAPSCSHARKLEAGQAGRPEVLGCGHGGGNNHERRLGSSWSRTTVSSAHTAAHSRHRAFCRPWPQIEDPPHSLQVDRRRPCSHMDAPPQSLHWDLRRPCSQKETPAHSLHRDFCRPWQQNKDPPHSLHADRRRPCVHRKAPPHSLHWNLRRLWMHSEEPPHSLHRDARRPWLQVDAPLGLFTDVAGPSVWLHSDGPGMISLIDSTFVNTSASKALAVGS